MTTKTTSTAKTKKATTKKAPTKKTTAKTASTKTASTKTASTKTASTKTTTAKPSALKSTTPTKTKTAKKPAAKKTTAAPTKKKATPVKSATKKTMKTTKKSTAKKAVVKSSTKKATTKKAAVKKKTTNKTAEKPAKKTAAKKAVKKTTTRASVKKSAVKADKKKPESKTVKSRVSSKVNASPKTKTVDEDTAATTADVKPTATKKKTATKKAATKKATRKKAVKEPAPKPVIVGKVGQAPRRTANEVAASNPFPVPPKLHEMQEEISETPSAESKAAKKDFKVNDKIVYPAHGVGVIEAIERQEIVGVTIEVFVIRFDHEKLTLRVPTEKAKTVGMRGLSDVPYVDKTITVLQGRARIKRTMWSRRAQEYEAKINSGDLNLVAEVVRDLYRAPEQPEQSYSERQLFEAALDRMSREVAAVKKIDLSAALGELEASLHKKQIAAA